MKKTVLMMTLLLGSVSAFAGNDCSLKKVDANGFYTGDIIEKRDIVLDDTAPVIISSKNGQYSLKISKTTTEIAVTVMKNGKPVLHTGATAMHYTGPAENSERHWRPVAISEIQSFRSTAVLNSNSGLSLACDFRN